MNDFIWGLIAGTLSTFLARKLFTINTSMDMMKYIECLFLIAASEIEQWRNHALKILEMTYENAGKEEEYKALKDKIDEKYKYAQSRMLEKIFILLPIKKKYTTLSQGIWQNRQDINAINKFMETKK